MCDPLSSLRLISQSSLNIFDFLEFPRILLQKALDTLGPDSKSYAKSENISKYRGLYI